MYRKAQPWNRLIYFHFLCYCYQPNNNTADILKVIINGFNALFSMLSLNCLKYEWNHFKKENTVKCNVHVCHIGYI